MVNKCAQNIGILVENLAVQLVQNAGMNILQRNFSCRFGEIDIVASMQDVVAFIEVRYRRHHKFGAAIDTVDRRKRQRILHTAEFYIQQHKDRDSIYRFDVVAVSGNLVTPQIQWIKDAFDAN